jgi:outer membrane protein TolC
LLPLYTGGRVGSQIAAAEHGRAAARHDLAAARADLVLETKTAYWSLVTAGDALDLVQEAIGAYDAHLADARNRERFGLAARNEVLAVQVERDRVELDRLRAEAAARIAAANLRRLLDLPADQDLEPSEPLLAPEAVAAPELEGLVAEALGSRPERAALAARAAAAEALVRLERGGRLPQLALAGGLTYANPNRDLVPSTANWKESWDLGASLTWSAIDFGRRSAGQARAGAQAQAAREQLRELERGIRLEVTQRQLELETAWARVPVAERAVASALENRRVAGDRYRAGVIPSSELLDAEVAHERASLALTEALAALRLAQAGLERALGR